jgi:SpoIIAA-like
VNGWRTYKHLSAELTPFSDVADEPIREASPQSREGRTLMNMTDPPVAVRRVDTDRQDVFAFEVKGHLEVSDIENIYGLLEGVYQLHPKIDVLLRMRNYDGIDWSAATRDLSLLGDSKALKHIRRYAVVGGPGWMSATLALFRPFFSIEMKHFEEKEEPEAWNWIGASEIPEKI